jgi:pimeloyl-ACP methyl ester carboxylesterase
VHRDREVFLGDRRFHYTEWGDPMADSVLFLHGVTGHARSWDDEARALAGAWHVVALDQRGHGDSEPAPDGDYSTPALAGDLAAFVDALGLAPARLVALSMGGRVAIAHAATHADTVDRLVVVDIGPEVAAPGRARVGAMMAQAPERFTTIDEALALSRANNPRYTEAMLRHRVTHALRPLSDGGFTWKYDRALRDRVRQGRWRDSVDLWPFWRAIACPVLIVRGAESDVLSPEIAKRMLEEQPRARLVEVPGAGHTVPGDQPEAFMRILVDFLG